MLVAQRRTLPLLRALRRHCPQCGSNDYFVSRFKLNERCPRRDPPTSPNLPPPARNESRSIRTERAGKGAMTEGGRGRDGGRAETVLGRVDTVRQRVVPPRRTGATAAFSPE